MKRQDAFKRERESFRAWRAKDYGTAIAYSLEVIEDHINKDILLCLSDCLYAVGKPVLAHWVLTYGITFFPQEQKFQYAIDRLQHEKVPLKNGNFSWESKIERLFKPPISAPTLSTCLIVRDEAPVIAACLQSVADITTEFIIVDTGSKDGTPELVGKLSDKVRLIHYPWQDNFSAARNVGLEEATGEWILIIDADERLKSEGISNLKRILSYPPIGVNLLVLELHNLLENGHHHSTVHTIRIFPNNVGIRYHGLVHNQLYQKNQLFLPNRIFLEGVVLEHIGFQQTIYSQKEKHKRVQLLEKSLTLPEYNTPYIHYRYAYSLLYQQHPPDEEKALKELEYSFEETLKHEKNPPSPTWFGANLSMVCLYIYRILDRRKDYSEIIARYQTYHHFCQYAEFFYLVANAFACTGALSQARQVLYRCFDPALPPLQPQAGYRTWRPLKKLKDIASQSGDVLAKAAYAQQQLFYAGTQETETESAFFFGALKTRIEYHLEQKNWQAVIADTLLYLPLQLSSDIFKILLASLAQLQYFGLYQVVYSYCLTLFPGQAFPRVEAPRSISPPFENLPESYRLYQLFSPSPQHSRVSSCLIVRNEAEHILECLQSIAPISDEIIIVDTGSTDHTLELIQNYYPQARIFHFPWKDDFSAARNFCLEQATGEWIFSIDADERLLPKSIPYLKRFFAYAPIGFHTFAIHVLSIYDDPSEDTLDTIPRIFPRHRCIRFYGLIHNYLYRTDSRFPLPTYLLKPVQIRHLGYQKKAIEKYQKRDRLHLLEKSLSLSAYNHPYYHFHYGYSLLYQQSPPQLEKALQAFEHAIRETLGQRSHPPAPGWHPAPLGFCCVYIFRILLQQERYSEILQRYPLLYTHCSYVEFIFLYGNALLEMGNRQAAKHAFRECLMGTWQLMQPNQGFHTWQPLLMLLYIALAENQLHEAIDCCYQLLEYFPDGQIPGQGNIQDVLANICDQALRQAQGDISA